MHIVILAASVVAAILVARGFVLYSGWILSLTVLFGANSLVLLARQEFAANGVINALIAFMFVPLVTTLVLPRSQILPVSVLSVVTYALSEFYVPLNSFMVEGLTADQQMGVAFVCLMGEGVLLRQLRVEFDDRLETMREANRQLEIARQEAEAARQRAEDADKSKTYFLANMSHELRTPLNAIIGYDEIMLGGMVGTFSPKQTELLGRIQHNSRRLLTLINDVLDLSKIESGSLEIYQSPMSPRKIIAESVENLRSLAAQKQISLSVELADNLPEAVLGDANKVQQILVNLVSNAIKFTDSGGVVVRARGVGKAEWQVEVKDTGIGMPREALTMIFEPFRQVDSTESRKHGGTGLGLSISKRLAEKMGGSIEVVSALGQGSTFTVTFPRVPVSETASDTVKN
jgi:signal transduction histidine kinase